MLNQISPVIIKDGKCYRSEEIVDFASPPVYEVIRVIDGIPLYFDEHIERLFNSLVLIHAKTNLSKEILLTSIETLVSETAILNNNVRLEIGEDQQGVSTWILFWVKSQYPDKAVYAHGVGTVTSKVTREEPHAKIYRKQYVDSINALKQETGAYEVILVKEDGIVTEGSRSNLFFILGGKLYSASGKDVLMGITRHKLILLLDRMDIELVERDISLAEIDKFEACFIPGTSIHLLPINAINDIVFGSAQHPLLIKLAVAFEQMVKDDLEHTRRL